MKKTKIVATIGPATESQEMLERLLEAGLNVMRLNFSHGDFEEHAKRVVNFRAALEKTGRRGAILQDLGGPKIRIGMFKGGKTVLVPGATFTLTTDEIEGDDHLVSINYKNLPQEVQPGHTIFLHDGKKQLEVLEVKGKEIVTKVIIGGEIKDKRGVNLPDSDLSISSLTEKDKKDLEFGVEHNVDFMALSFVRRPEDIDELRNILKEKGSKARIIAKVETPQAVKNIDEIIRKSDGIMVARGDLAIEIPAEKVPGVQKMIINKCNDAGKPVITATQMLESMIHSPVPTRAEVSDIANAILDGTDAVMLSEETALGEFPLESLKTMAKVAREMEKHYPERDVVHKEGRSNVSVTDSLTGSVVKTAHDVGAKAIVCLTESGYTSRMISRHKPHSVIFSLSPNEKTCNHLCLSFGCMPVLVEKYDSIEKVFQAVREIALKYEVAKTGDKVVIAAGALFFREGSTNMMVVETL